MTEVEYKDPTTTLAYISSDPPRPVGPVHPTGRHPTANFTGPTDLRKTERLHTQPTSVQLNSALT